MSIDFTVVCRWPLPPDWGPDLPFADLPFAVSVEPFDAWKAHTQADLAAQEAEGELDAKDLELRSRLDDGGSFVVSLGCRARAAELVDLCAQELVQRFGGFYYDDHSDALSPIFPGMGAASAREVATTWRRLVADGALREHRLADQARRDWQEAASQDPASFDRDNDWSDV